MGASISIVQLTCLQRKVKMHPLDITLFRLAFFCSVEAHTRFGGTYCLHLEVLGYVKQATNKWLADCSFQIISSSLRRKAVFSSETSVELYQTVRSHIPEDKYSLQPKP
jgi:hypothetical protein